MDQATIQVVDDNQSPSHSGSLRQQVTDPTNDTDTNIKEEPSLVVAELAPEIGE